MKKKNNKNKVIKYLIPVMLVILFIVSFKVFVPVSDKSSENDNDSKIVLENVPDEYKDDLLRLGETWSSIDESLTDEMIKQELEFFYVYAYERSSFSGESIETIIDNQIKVEEENHA